MVWTRQLMARKGIWERLLQWTLSVREEWCECCLTAQERRRGVLKRLIGMSYVEHEDMPRYKTLQEESKKVPECIISVFSTHS